MKINYIGGGYVGLTGACHYAMAGHDVTISDTDPTVVDAINAGRPKAGAFLHYLQALPCVRASLIPDFDADAYFISVPSEKNGEPFLDIVYDVFAMLCGRARPSVPIIVESTLMPGTASQLRALVEMGAPRRPWAIAPRRDWFADTVKNLCLLTRIVGRDEEHHQALERLFTCVCRSIRWTSPETAEITKALENALLHLPVVLLHELAILYPEYDMVEAAELASTHWRFHSMGKLYLGLGTGGRCVPLGSKYLNSRGGALLSDAIEIDERFAEGALLEALGTGTIPPRDPGFVLVLGIAYRPGFKDAGSSPGLRAALALDPWHPDVCDPYFTRSEIEALRSRQGAKWIASYEGLPTTRLEHYDTIVLTVAHPEFFDLWKQVKPGATVIDATGVWEEPLTRQGNVRYIRPGRPGWAKREEAKP